jgi:uncharacterized membrane protein
MRFAVAALIILLLAQCAAGVSYYGDIVVRIDPQGISSISGRTNHPGLQPQTTSALTSKKGGYWLFNMTLPKDDIFSDYVYEVSLPEGASVNYVKASGQFRITSADGKIAIKGAGSNGSLSILVQYQQSRENKTDETSLVLAAAAFVLLAAAGVVIYRRQKVKEPEDAAVPQSHEGILTERQKDILRLIFEAGKPVNQTLICEKLDLPKSSVSRNIQGLVKLGLIKKTRVGMSTFLSMPEDK